MRRTKEEALRTKEKLLESALDIMSKQPFSKVSVNEIAMNAGLSKGAAYWHFKNKEDMLVSILERYKREEEALWHGCEKLESWNDLGAYFKGKVEEFEKNERCQKMHRLLLRHMEWPGEIAEKITPVIRDGMKREREMVEKILRKHEGRIRIKDSVTPEEGASFVTSIFHGLIFSLLDKLHPLNASKHLDSLLDTLTAS